MLNKLKTAPATEPLTLAEVRAWLGITQGSDNARDAMITANIVAARNWAEIYTRKAFITQTWLHYRDSFVNYTSQGGLDLFKFYDSQKLSGPVAGYPQEKIYLLGPLQSVTSVKYYDTNGALQTVDPSIYFVDTANDTIVLNPNKSWPVTYARDNSVIIEYISGYTSVPEDIKTAIKFLVGHWENYQRSVEGSSITTVPYAVKQLLDNYRDMRGYFDAEVTR